MPATVPPNRDAILADSMALFLDLYSLVAILESSGSFSRVDIDPCFVASRSATVIDVVWLLSVKALINSAIGDSLLSVTCVF